MNDQQIVPLPVPPPHRPSILYRAKAFTVFVFMFLASYFGSIFMETIAFPLAFVAPRVFKRYVDTTIYMWFKLTEFLLVCVLDIRVRHFGDEWLDNTAQRKANFLMVLNHRTRLDWMYTWLLGERLQSTKIVLKAVLGAIPGAGWAMNICSFIFLERKLNLDVPRIKQAAAYLTNVGERVEVFIFPEGTDLDHRAVNRNRDYALKNGKDVTQYTLHPRVSGTLLLLNQFIADDSIQYVYDMTVAYPFHFPTHEPHVICGILPREVHFFVRRYPIGDLPVRHNVKGKKELNRDEFTKWLDGVWKEKESMLEEYYRAAPEQRKFRGAEIPLKGAVYDWTTGERTLEGNCVFAYWAIMIPVMLSLICTSNLIFYYFCFANFLCVYIWYTKRSGISAWIAGLAGYPIEMFDDKQA
ncbi:Lysocardiolipin acyltransferase 1 [Cichlidogyrus casuarinus]|uniref:Lysocardiolipin acyltransferase 1 n=1 Tax=Cichlidogyrus casuarinus TaxID=1844966 RepID=A0ABD2PVB4_9PLAT